MPANVVFIDKQHQVDELLPKLMEKPVWGTDSETTGLDPFKEDVLAWQFGRPEVQYVIDNRKVNIEPIRPFMESKKHKKLLHNALFDYKMGAVNNDIEMENMRCTQIAEQLLEQGYFTYKGKFSLENVIDRRLGIQLDKDTQKSFIGHTGDFTPRQIKYMGEDVEHLLPLAQNQTKDIMDTYLGNTYLLECEFIPCLGDMELGGFRLNTERWRQTMEENRQSREEVRKKLDVIAGQYFANDLFGNVDINYNSSDQVLKLYQYMGLRVKVWNHKARKYDEIPFGKGDGKWSKTGVKDTKSLSDIPAVQMIAKYRSYCTLIDMFGESYIRGIHPVTGRIHGEFWQLGTATGRLSSKSDFNLLNIPRDARYRNAFEAYGPDYVVETDDYSGCELRIWAEISKDPELMKAFMNNIDVHCHVATKCYRVEVTKTNENKRLRQPAKNLNFGIAYGMGPGTLFEDLNAQGFAITRPEAKDVYKTYCKEFDTGVTFLRSSGDRALAQGFLDNINGRRRYWNLPDKNHPKYEGICAAIKREGGNFLIQSVNADITKKGMINIRDYKKAHKTRTNFANQVYDEIVTVTHKDDSEHFHSIKTKLMVKAGQEYIKEVPIEVEGSANPYWVK